MSSDEELARRLQKEELAAAGLQLPLQDINSTQELDSLTTLDFVRILEQGEENVSSLNSEQFSEQLNEHQEREIHSQDSHEEARIVDQAEADSDSFQLAMRLQQEEEEQARQEEMERAAMMRNFDYQDDPQEINPCEPHFHNCNDDFNNIVTDGTDEEFLGAVAGTQFCQPQCIPDWQGCSELNLYSDLGLCVATDEQMAKLIQEQENVEEMANSAKLARQLQEEDGAERGNYNPDRSDRPNHVHRIAGPKSPYQNKEMDEATRRVISKIVEEEAQSSLQLAMRLEQEERERAEQVKRERLAIGVDSDSDDDVNAQDFNVYTDDDFFGAAAATHYAQSRPLPDWSNSRDRRVANDEQVARLIQDQEQADEMADSFKLALQLQEKEEGRAWRRNYNHNRPRNQAFRKPTERRPNQGLRQRAMNGNSSFYHQPHRGGSGTINQHRSRDGDFYDRGDAFLQHQFGDRDFYNGGDPFLPQANRRDTDQDAFLLPPGLQDFQLEAGVDAIAIPEDSNFEELLELTEAIGDVSCGLSAAQMDKLPTRTWTAGGRPSGGDDLKCSICLSDFVANDTVRTLPCKHEFHKNCVDPWLKKKTSCPTCRTDIKV